MAVQIRDIMGENFIDAMRLRVRPEQAEFVAPNSVSIAQSKFHSFLECYGIYDGETMVGFSAGGVNPDDGTVWIVRHMVGAEFQGRGYGREGLRSLVVRLRATHGLVPVFLDVAPSNAAAIALYESEGFRDTGRTQGKSRVYCLDADGCSALPAD